MSGTRPLLHVHVEIRLEIMQTSRDHTFESLHASIKWARLSKSVGMKTIVRDSRSYVYHHVAYSIGVHLRVGDDVHI